MRQVADLVQAQRPAVGGLDQTGRVRVRTREGALAVAEELRKGQLGPQRAAVHGQEGPVRPGGERVDGAGDELLAGPGLTRDQHRQIGARRALGQGLDPLHGVRVGDQRGSPMLVARRSRPRSGLRRAARAQQALQLLIGALEPLVGRELGEEGAGAVQVAPAFARLGHGPAQLEQRAGQLVALAQPGQHAHRVGPAAHGILVLAPGPGDGRRRTMRQRQLEPVLRALRQAEGPFAGALRLVQPAQPGQRVGPAALQLDHQVALGGQARGQR